MTDAVRRQCSVLIDSLRCYSATWLKRAVARYEATGEEPYIPVRIGETASALWMLIKTLVDEGRQEAGGNAARIEPPYSTPVFNTGCGKKDRKKQSKELSPTPPIEKKKRKKEKKASAPACGACGDEGDAARDGTSGSGVPQSSPQPPASLVTMVHAYYNAAAAAGLVPLPPLDRRLAHSMERALQGYGYKETARAIDRAAACDILTGKTGRGFRADFFWIFEMRHFTRIESGFYDNKKTIGRNGDAIRLLAGKYREEQLGIGCKAEVERTLW